MNRKYHDTFYHGNFYHIFNRSINKEIIFRSSENCRYFLQQWNKYLMDSLLVYAYCLLHTHFHFFARVNERFKIPEQFPDINAYLENQFMLFLRSYSKAFNKVYNRDGSLMKKSFRRIWVDNDRYFAAVIHYIHHNPIHHKCTTDFTTWTHSSYKAIISSKPTYVNRDGVLDWFGSKEEFIAFHQQDLDYDKIEKYIVEE